MTYGNIGIIVGVLESFCSFSFSSCLIAIVLEYLGYKNGDEKNREIAMILGVVGIALLSASGICSTRLSLYF